MGISVGSGSVKPYVGGTEIKEAYVGSELVYQSKLPYIYYFLGAENDYVINPNCVLTRNSSIVKPPNETTYKIALSYNNNTEIGGIVDAKGVGEYVGSEFEFVHRTSGLASSAHSETVRVEYTQVVSGVRNVIRRDIITVKNGDDYNLYTGVIPANTTEIRITAPDGSTYWSFYINDMRIMFDTPTPTSWENPLQEGSKLKITQTYFAKKSGNKLEVE